MESLEQTVPLYADITADGQLVGHNLPPLEQPIEHSAPAPPPITSESYDTFAFNLHEAQFEAKWDLAFGPQANNDSGSIIRARPQRSEGKGESGACKIAPQAFENPAYIGPHPEEPMDSPFDSAAPAAAPAAPPPAAAAAAATTAAATELEEPSAETATSTPADLQRPTSANDVETSFAILPITEQSEKKVTSVKLLPVFQFAKKRKEKKEKKQKEKQKQKYNLAFVQPPSSSEESV